MPLLQSLPSQAIVRHNNVDMDRHFCVEEDFDLEYYLIDGSFVSATLWSTHVFAARGLEETYTFDVCAFAFDDQPYHTLYKIKITVAQGQLTSCEGYLYLLRYYDDRYEVLNNWYTAEEDDQPRLLSWCELVQLEEYEIVGCKRDRFIVLTPCDVLSDHGLSSRDAARFAALYDNPRYDDDCLIML